MIFLWDFCAIFVGRYRTQYVPPSWEMWYERMRYHFADYSLDREHYELQHQGKPLKVRRKVFDLLVYLLEQRHRVVSQNELLTHLWPEHYVTPSTLTSCVREARQALGDQGRAPRIIHTLHAGQAHLDYPVKIWTR